MSTATAADYDTLFGFITAGLIAFGGLLGFLRKGSVASLIAGGASGAILAYGVRLQQFNPQDVRLVTGAAGTLAVVMGNRFRKGRKFMPAGLVTILSLALCARFGSRLLN